MASLGRGLVCLIFLGGCFSINGCGSGAELAGEVEVSETEAEALRRRVPCASSDACREGEFCTTETGACNRPPGCRPGRVCPAVCYGVCQSRPAPCGSVTCGPGLVCCNESCGVCTRPGGVCTQQICEPPVECRRDSDCRAFSDYCTGCDCRALASGEPDPVCPGPGVQCLVDPCFNQRAVCASGQCELQAEQ
jgi:hypothetical protein